MGCNCKKTYDKVKKFADNREQLKQEEDEINQNIVNNVAKWITQIIFGIIAACLFIIVAIPVMIYVTGCVLIGKEPTIRIKSPNKIFKKKDAR